MGQPMPQGGPMGQRPFGVNPANYKRDICKYYESGRQCPYQNRCSFAHGNNDIRTQTAPFQQVPGGLPHQMPASRGGQMTPQMTGPRVSMPGQMPPVLYPNGMVMQDWQMPQLQPQQQFSAGANQHMQPIGGSPYMDGQYFYMQPGLMNPQFMGFDPSSHAGFPMAPVDIQQ